MVLSQIELCSPCTCWQDLARDLVSAIDQLEAQNKQSAIERDDLSVLLTVESGMNAIRLTACRSDAVAITPADAGIRLFFSPLPVATDQDREDYRRTASSASHRYIGVDQVTHRFTHW